MTQPHDPYTRALLAQLLRPRTRLSVSRWADRTRVLSPKASSEPGPWRTDRTPYLREPMDALSEDSPVSRVCVMKSAQMGVTELAVNWVGYIMDHIRQSKPTLIVVPTDKLLVRWVHQRLRPMIENAASLAAKLNTSRSRDGTNRLDLIDYPGGLLQLASAGSAANLKSDSICYVVCDEADEYDWDVEGRGDPLGLIESRQSNFPRRKLLIFSTPTVQGASRIEGEWHQSDQRHYHVPCPSCGEYQPLRWEHMGWERDGSRAWYTCAINGCVIDERAKPHMLSAGRWVAQHPERRGRGYHLNALYAPIGLGYSWPELVQQYLDAQDSDERLQHFYNERLGLPWQDRRTAVKADSLSQHAEHYRLRTVPEGALLLTAGIDTQDDRLEAQIIGWGEHGHWWIIDYVQLWGAPNQPDCWAALTDLLHRPLESAGGTPIGISLAAIDLGGHHAQDVKQFVHSRRCPNLIAVIGSRYRLDRVLGRPRKTDFWPSGRADKQGFAYHPVGTELAKDALFATLRADTHADAPQDRRGHFSADLEASYYEGLLSESWNPKRARYEPKRGATRRNEPLDTWVYAYAAAHHPQLRLDRMRPIDWARLRERYGPAEPTAPRADTRQAPPPQPPQRPAQRQPPAPPPAPPSDFVKDDWSF